VAKGCACWAAIARQIACPRAIFPSPSARRIATSADESHPLNSAAPLATILNDIFTFSVGGAFLKLHCLFGIQCSSRDLSAGFYRRSMISSALAQDHFPFVFSQPSWGQDLLDIQDRSRIARPFPCRESVSPEGRFV
jgi:hypothetical protein